MNIAIYGATSAIAQATAIEMLNESQTPPTFSIIGRNRAHLESVADDLLARGAKEVHVFEQELSSLDALDTLTNSIWEKSGGIDKALIAHGTLPDQDAIQNSWDQILQAYNINALSYISILTSLVKRMDEKGSGTIGVISSVAGDRGRKSNYIYGSAKGCVSLFTQGLRNRLHGTEVHITTIKPGLVDSPMTSEFDKKGLLWSTPQNVGEAIARGLSKKKDVIYVPGFWFCIMAIIKLIPEKIFKRLSL